MERQSSNEWENLHSATTNPNVFSDEFALDTLSNVSTPSSPGAGAGSPASFNHPSSPLEPNHSSIHTHDIARVRRSPLRHEGPSSRFSRPLSQNYVVPVGTGAISDATSTPHRPISSISNFPLPRTQSPYQGATEPSHPYGMYPQDVGIARHPSSTTNSTIRMPERLYAGPDGPTQPYGIYSQNTVPEDEISPVTVAMPSTHGFPGLRRNYQRRFGPDGEEAADIVGPDGYTEQLPPYSPYPNDVPPKNALPVEPINPPNPTDTPVDERHGSQSTESAAADQSGSSQDTLNPSQTPDSSQSAGTIRVHAVGDVNSLTHLNPPSGQELSNEGGHFKERFKETSQRKICGKLPFWPFIVFIVVLAVLLGVVIGVVLSKTKQASQGENNISAPDEPTSVLTTATVTRTASFDAVPFTSATNLPTLPTGSFSIMLGGTSSESKDCLNNSDQLLWDCSTRGSLINMTVTWDTGENLTRISLKSSAPSIFYRYGPQPPQISNSSTVTVVKDRDDLDRGPAFHFQMPFDKLIILSAERFPIMKKRSVTEKENYKGHAVLDERDGNDREYTQAKDSPWFCYWNGTVLEAYIFITQDAMSATPPSPSVLSGHNSNVNNLVTTSSPLPTTTTLQRDPSNVTNYPKVVKIEERRNAENAVSPYCQQMRIDDDGSAIPLGYRIPLHEVEPPTTSGMKQRDFFEGLPWEMKRSDPQGCQCKWLLQ